MVKPVSRPTKSAAESAEKLSSIFGTHQHRKHAASDAIAAVVTLWRIGYTLTSASTKTSLLVLDTNAVLAWLFFKDPSCAKLGQALLHQRVTWIATPAMRQELIHVLERGLANKSGVPVNAVLSLYDTIAQIVPTPELPGSATCLRCTDPDDQKFIDLAQACRAQWLLSRDRALLKLARRARAFAVQITTPERWSPHDCGAFGRDP